MKSRYKFIEIGEHKVGANYPPYVVAEISANHLGSLDQAKNLIELAKTSGASAVKLQTYTPDTITIDSDKPDFKISAGPWAGHTLYSLYEMAHTPFEWHKDLYRHASDVGIPIFSSPFDNTAVDLLESLRTPAYKIASFEIVDLPLIDRVSRTGKPVIISTGLATLEEIHEAVRAAKGAGCNQLALLHCTSAYPTPYSEMNLAKISDLGERFGCIIGVSDHTEGISIPVAAVAFGAVIIEKHFTQCRNQGGPDASFSLEPGEFFEMVRSVNEVWEALGEATYSVTETEQVNRVFRRSIYVIEDIELGESLTEKNIRIIRPGFGLPPKYWQAVLGRKAAQPLERGTALKWEHVSC